MVTPEEAPLQPRRMNHDEKKTPPDATSLFCPYLEQQTPHVRAGMHKVSPRL